MLKTIQVNRTKTSYIELNPEKDQHLVLLHSFPSSKELFEKHFRLLNQRYHIIAPDLPGFGQSENPLIYDIHSYKQWLEEFLSKLKLELKKTTIWGVSFGGLITLSIDELDSFRRVVLEAVPLSDKCIKTREVKVAKLFQSLPKELVQKMIAREVIRKMILKIYYFVKPKSEQKLADNILHQYLVKLRLDSVFQILEILRSQESYQHCCGPRLSGNNLKIIYDQYDPTVKWQKVNFLEKGNIITTNYHVHVPSVWYTKQIIDKIGL